MKAQRLTKSRFKLGCDCPTKIHYAAAPQSFQSCASSPFLDALAQGGYQVGELAKLMHPGGVEVATLDEAKALQETAQLLEAPTTTVFEAAVGVPAENLLVRVDILTKGVSGYELIEVKAKSWDPAADSFWKARGRGLRSEWLPYLLDVAFQAWVLRRALPAADLTCSLMLVNKGATCEVDGLHQRFLACKAADPETGKMRLRCKVQPGPTPASRGGELLVRLPVDEQVRYLHEEWRDEQQRSFAQVVNLLADACATGKRVPPHLGAHCKGCEFRPAKEDLQAGQLSGLVQCWLERTRCSKADLQSEPLVLDLWNNRQLARQLDEGTWLLRDVDPGSMTRATDDESGGLSSGARQSLQVQKAVDRDSTPFVDANGLRARIAQLAFPLHFVDFETAAVAIPFVAGRRPYEQLAFQFSHHVMHADGRVEHRGQFLDDVRGSFPNYRFLRALNASLGDMGGSFIHFAAHENTVLGQIRRQLLDDPAPVPDRDQLVEFVERWASPGKNETWVPSKQRVDLRDWILKCFYDPATGGSNSIKAVLPAVMKSSRHLEQRYGRPTYGTAAGMPSRNFEAMQWFVRDERGGVKSPYELLGPVFLDAEEIGFDERLFRDDEIREGGAAMTAYMRMQFEEMRDEERAAIRAALLRYCELDTLAMVMVFEHLQSLVNAGR